MPVDAALRRRFGRVPDAVLAAQILLDLGVDLVDGLAVRNLEEPASGFAGDLLQHLLAIGPVVSAASRHGHPAHAAAASHSPSAHSRAAHGLLVGIGVGEQHGIDQGIRLLGGCHRLEQGVLAARIHAIGEQDERFSPLLLGHQLIGGQVDGIVHIRAPAAASAAGLTATATRVSASGIAASAALSLPLALLQLLLIHVELVQRLLQVFAGRCEIL